MEKTALAERLEIVKQRGKFSDGVVAKLADHIEQAPDEALFRMNPLRFARKHGIPQRAAVDLFLQATHAGVLDFSWGVLCPWCHAFLNTAPMVRALQARRRCGLCQQNVQPADDNVEVAFTVSAQIRKIRFHQPSTLDLREDLGRLFFSSNYEWPAPVHHSIGEKLFGLAQLQEGATEVKQEFKAGSYTLFVPTHHAVLHVNVAPEHRASSADLDLVAGQFLPEEIQLRPGEISLRINHRLGAPVWIAWFPEWTHDPMMHPKEWPYFTGKGLLTSQTFRELFRAESIPAEGGLELRNLTVLFTDLKGSTELYERVGDFRAYGLVRDHFNLLRDIIAQRGGAMVKTIGDAVMASFAEPTPALEAAVDMHQRIGAVGDLHLKIGLHSGPCIAVESNERLDYFGQTVNIASRVQGVADADQIVCTEPVFAAPGAQDLIRSASLSALRGEELLKGVDGRVTVYRLR